MRSRLLLSTALTLVAFAPIALAQDAAPPAPAAGENPDAAPPIEKVTVTAQKRKQRLQDVPISVKSLDGEELAKVNADGLEDVTRMVPSLTMTNISRGGNQVQIRGLGSNVGSVGTVAIYNDGVIASSRIQSSGTFAEQDSALYDIERVEVLRGPQGTLYGEGSFGGVINIISKSPNPNAMEASFSGSWFDVEEGSSENYDVNAMVNIPIVKDVLAVRGVYYNYDHDGYIDVVNISPPLAGLLVDPSLDGPPELVAEDANTQEIRGGRFIVGFTPSDTFDAKFTYKTENTKQGINSTASPHQIAFINALKGTNFNPDLTQAMFGPPFSASNAFGSESTVNEGILELNIDLGIGQLTSITGYGTTESENTAAFFDAEAWSEELRLGSNSDGPFNWILGFYYRDANRDIDFASGVPFVSDELKQWAAFGQAYWEFVPSWTLTAGLRYEEQESVFTDKTVLVNPTSKGEFSSVIPKVALDWKVDPDTLLYASVAKGFRAGGSNIDYSVGNDPAYQRTFDPDSIWNYELGAKTGLFGGIVTVNTAVFYIDWSTIQIDQAILNLLDPGNPSVSFITVNGEDAHAYGIESDIYIRPTDNLDITLGGSLVNAEYDGGVILDNPGVLVPIDGMRLPSSPEYLFNASIEQRFPLDTNLEGYLRGDMSIRGSSFGDVPNTPPTSLLGDGDFTSGQSTFVNLRAGVRGEVWELQAFVNNVFDERASTFTFFDGGFADVNSVLRPRTIGLNLKLRYSDEEN